MRSFSLLPQRIVIFSHLSTRFLLNYYNDAVKLDPTNVYGLRINLNNSINLSIHSVAYREHFDQLSPLYKVHTVATMSLDI